MPLIFSFTISQRLAPCLVISLVVSSGMALIGVGQHPQTSGGLLLSFTSSDLLQDLQFRNLAAEGESTCKTPSQAKAPDIILLKSSVLMGLIREMPGVSLNGETSRIIIMKSIGKDFFFLLFLYLSAYR